MFRAIKSRLLHHEQFASISSVYECYTYDLKSFQSPDTVIVVHTKTIISNSALNTRGVIHKSLVYLKVICLSPWNKQFQNCWYSQFSFTIKSKCWHLTAILLIHYNSYQVTVTWEYPLLIFNTQNKEDITSNRKHYLTMQQWCSGDTFVEKKP